MSIEDFRLHNKNYYVANVPAALNHSMKMIPISGARACAMNDVLPYTPSDFKPLSRLHIEGFPVEAAAGLLLDDLKNRSQLSELHAAGGQQYSPRF